MGCQLIAIGQLFFFLFWEGHRVFLMDHGRGFYVKDSDPFSKFSDFCKMQDATRQNMEDDTK